MRVERGGIRVVGELCFQILFDFATLLIQTALPTVYLGFRFFLWLAHILRELCLMNLFHKY